MCGRRCRTRSEHRRHPSALEQLDTCYTATFNNIRRNAQAALASPDQGSALTIIDAAGAQQAAASAQASQLCLAADAAALVAKRLGKAARQRVLAAALEAQAVDAAKVSVAMSGQAAVLYASPIRSESVPPPGANYPSGARSAAVTPSSAAVNSR